MVIFQAAQLFSCERIAALGDPYIAVELVFVDAEKLALETFRWAREYQQ